MKHRIWAAAMAVGLAMSAIGSGCGGGTATPPASSGVGRDDGRGARSGAAKKRGKLMVRTTKPISPRALAFMSEAEKADDDAGGRQWLADAHAAVHALQSGNPALAQGLGAPPPTVTSALRAFDEWAKSGEPVSIAEQRAEMSTLFPSFRLVESLAAVVEHSDDPRVSSALRFAKALRAPDNAAIAIALGSSLAGDWAKVLVQGRKEPVTAALRDYAVTEEDAMVLGRALVSESLVLARMITFEDWKREAFASGVTDASDAPKPRRDDEPGSAFDPATFSEVVRYREQHGLSTGGNWVSEEFAAYDEFWNETEALVVNAVSPAELISIFDARLALAIEHPTSMLLRLVSGMVMMPSASQIVETCMDDAQIYAELLVGANAK